MFKKMFMLIGMLAILFPSVVSAFPMNERNIRFSIEDYVVSFYTYDVRGLRNTVCDNDLSDVIHSASKTHDQIMSLLKLKFGREDYAEFIFDNMNVDIRIENFEIAKKTDNELFIIADTFVTVGTEGTKFLRDSYVTSKWHMIKEDGEFMFCKP